MPINLSGTWRLDASRSDSILPYLSALGVPDLASQASSKLVDIISISQTNESFIICRMSRFGRETKELKFGEENIAKSVTNGNHRITINNEGEMVKTVTILANEKGVLTDVRLLEDHGRTMHTILTLLCADGKQVITNRFFTRTNLTCEELLEQGEGGNVKSPREEFDSE